LQAFFALERALRADPGRQEVRREAAEAALVLKFYAQAREHLNLLQESAPDDPGVERQLGECEEASGRYEDAAYWFEKASCHEPDPEKVIYDSVRHALLLRHQRLGKPAEADGVVKKMVDARPRSVPERLAAASYYMKFGLWDEAEKNLHFALTELASDHPAVFLLASEVAEAQARASRPEARQGRKEQIRRILEQGLKAHPQDARLNLALARLELQDRQPAKAAAALRRALAADPTQPEDLSRLADMLIDVDQLAEAGRVMERLCEKGGRAQANYHRARLLTREGAWGQARPLLEYIRSQGDTPEWTKGVNLLLAQCNEHLENPEGALVAYRQALEVDPLWLPALLGQAAVLARLGRTGEAVEAYEKAVPQAPELSLGLARLQLQRNLSVPPERKHWDEVEQALSRLPETARQSLDAQLLWADALVAQDKLEAARKVLETERGKHPKQVHVWLGLAGLADRQGKSTDVAALLREAEKELGQRPELLLARVNFAARKGGAEGRQAVAEGERALEAFTGDDQNQLLRGLGDAAYRLGDRAAAVRLWGRVAAKDKKDLKVRLLLFDAAHEVGDDAAMERLLGEIREIEGPDGPLYPYGEVTRLLARARSGDKEVLAQAWEWTARAKARRPGWAGIPLMEAQLLEAEGKPEVALEKYQRAIEGGVLRPAVLRRAVELLYEYHRYAEAQDILAKLPDAALVEGGLARQAAELTFLRPDQGGVPERKRALDLARRAVPKNSKNFGDYLWLGQIALHAGDRGAAEEMLRRAVALADREPDPRVALVLLLAPHDRKRALAALEEARRLLPPLALGACYEAVGQLAEAKQQYAAALEAQPDNPDILQNVAAFFTRTGQFLDAEPVLRRLLEPGRRSPDWAQPWVRRQLAIALAGNGSYPKCVEALALLDANGPRYLATSQDERIRAMVLANLPGRRQEAIQLLERQLRLSLGKGLTPQEEFLLARLYEADGDWPRARAQLADLLEKDSGAQAHVSHYAQVLLEHGEVAAAAPWIEKLEAAEGKPSFGTVALRARLLYQQGRADEAVRRLRAYGQDQPDQVGAVAAVLEGIGRPAEAESAYREYATRSREPEAVLLLARYLARQQRLGEALGLCERAWPIASAEDVGATCLAVLRAGSPTEQQCRIVKRQLAAAAQQQPQSFGLVWVQAELQELQGHYAEAIALYRQVLLYEPQSVVALNDLAFLLALKEGQGAEALELLQKAIDLDGPRAELVDSRAVAYLATDQARQAVKDLEGVIAYAAKPSLYFHLARAHHQAKDRQAAVQALHKAKELGLTAASLHPLERETYQRLLQDLE
jgi:tetratricopeptide (TPR) repeat protein